MSKNEHKRIDECSIDKKSKKKPSIDNFQDRIERYLTFKVSIQNIEKKKKEILEFFLPAAKAFSLLIHSFQNTSIGTRKK